MIPYGRQDISEADIQAIEDVLHSEWLTQGPAVPRFETVVSEYCAVNFSVTVCNATAALHLACRALGLGSGDILWTTPNTFVSSANCALYCGATVDFVDINPRTYNIGIDALREKLVSAEREGRLPKIVVPVHFAGQSCEMREIKKLADIYGFRIIEDASHAIGGKYLDGRVGNCHYSDITVFSFHPVKIITTGEGGMALTNDSDLANRMRLLRSHGITRDPALMVGECEGGWYYQQIELGYNYRMTDIQAALGASQMRRIDAFIARRKEIADYYDTAFASLPIGIPQRSDEADSAWHLYVIQVDEARTGKSRKAVFDALRAQGIQVNVHYIPVHLQPYYRNLGFTPGDFPAAEHYYAQHITLPLYAGLAVEEQNQIIKELGNVLECKL